MDTSLLKQFGGVSTGLGIALSVAAEYLPTALVESLAPHQPVLLIGGLAALLVGIVLDNANRRRCQRCARRALGSSVFCAAHRQMLDHEAGLARTRRRTDNRGFY